MKHLKSISYLKAASLLAIIVPFSAIYGGGGGSPPKMANVCNSNVITAGSSCNVGNVALNKVGDKVNYPTDKLTLTENFGKVAQDITKELSISLPNQDFTKSATMYAFTPTKGSRFIKDEEMKLLLVSLDLKALPSWTPASVQTEASDIKTKYDWAKAYVKLYRQLKGEPAEQWTELGSTVLEAKSLEDPKNLKVKIKIQPDAKATIYLPAHLDDAGNLVKEEPVEADLSKLG